MGNARGREARGWLLPDCSHSILNYVRYSVPRREREVLARTHQKRGNQAYALRLLGEIAARSVPLEVGRAETHYQQALALAAELGMRPLQAHCHRGLGTLYAATGQQEQARRELATAIALYELMEMTFWLPQTKTTLAQVEGR